MSNRFSSAFLVTCGLLAAHAAAAAVNPLSSSSGITHVGDAGRRSEAAGGASVAGLQEIVVTATRRKESVQSVPFQVTAMTARDLTRIDAHNLGGFAAYVPGLITDSGAAPGLIAIRGVTMGTGGQLSSAIGLYLDGVPLGASTSFGLGYQSFNIDTFDLERVEVLNGPQGTLYGANSLGGAIKYVAAAPDPHALHGTAETEISHTEHGGTNYGLRGMLNLPFGGGFGALRIDGIDNYDSGYMTDPVYHRNNQGATRNEGGRVQLLLAPTRRLDVRLSVFYQRDGSVGLDTAFRNFVTHRPTIGTYDQAYPLEQPAVSSLMLYSAQINWRAPWFTLTSITGDQADHGYSLSDESLVYDALLASFGAASDPFQLPVDTNTHRTTQEVRLVSRQEGRLRWILGGYYDHESTNEIVDLFDRANAGGTFFGLVPFNADLPSSYREVAGYADATISLTGRLSLGLGVRYSTQHQSYQETTFGLFATGSNAVYDSPVAVTNQSVTTYSINPKYQLTPDVMLYVRAASGFRPGGPNFVLFSGLHNPSFAPDKLWNYELGEKSSLFDRRVQFDFDVYDIEWHRIQLVVNNGGVNQLENGNNARVQGAEMSFRARLTQRLTLDGSAAYTHAWLTGAVPVLEIGYSGARLPMSPRFNFALLGTYRFKLAAGHPAALTVSDRWLGQRTEGFGTSASARYSLPSFNTVDFDLALDLTHALSADLYLKNAFDTAGQVDATTLANEYDPAAPTPVIISQPRTVGIVLRANF
jgi:outer membrane receptor protein involved in Fe transport